MLEETTVVDSVEFRNALRQYPSGVTVVTAKNNDSSVFGVTVSAFMSVSLEPPLIVIGIDKKGGMHELLMSNDEFGVSLLKNTQAHISDAFAHRVPMPADPYEYLNDFPVVAGAAAQIVCRMWQRIDAGDHTLFIGELTATAVDPEWPLLYYNRDYRLLADDPKAKEQ